MDKPVVQIIDELIEELQKIKTYNPMPDAFIVELKVSGKHIVCDVDRMAVVVQGGALRLIGHGDVVGYPAATSFSITKVDGCF